jgi:hypothetical protein
MAYDPVRRRVLLFGGTLPEASDELWELDTAAVRWQRVAAAGDWPSARSGHALVLDEDRNVLVLQGGLDASAATLYDTWELAAGDSTWQRRASDASAPRWDTPVATFVRGLGVVTVADVPGSRTSDRFITRWDGTAATWVPTGVDPPPDLSLSQWAASVAGADDTMILLVPGWPSRPAQDASFAATWEWKAR